MYQDRISARQLYVILFTALLSPAVRALPAWTAGRAGVGAWLTGILAFPVLLLLGWVVWKLLRTAPEGGLAEVFQNALGRTAGKGLTIIYMVWALILLALETRLYGERMVAAGGKNASLPVLLLILLGLVLWLGRKKLAAFARAAEIFYLILAVTLGLVLAFSIADLKPENVLPVWFGDIPEITEATLAPIGVAAPAVFGGFLAGSIPAGQGEGRRGARWLLALCLTFAALQFAVLAQMGPELSAHLEAPFFEVARGVGVDGAFQRVESVVVALWLLSDLAMLGLLVFALRAMARTVFGARWEKWTPFVAVGAAFFGAVWALPDGFFAQRFSEGPALFGNLILGFAVPALLLAIRGFQKRSGKGHI